MNFVNPEAWLLRYELILVTPYLYWLHQRGLLNKTVGALGSATSHFFSPQHVEMDIVRTGCKGPMEHLGKCKGACKPV